MLRTQSITAHIETFARLIAIMDMSSPLKTLRSMADTVTAAHVAVGRIVSHIGVG